MKRILALVLMVMTLVGCLLAPMGASADTIYGKNSKKVTFKIVSNAKNSYFVLSSSTGLARVAQHNFLGFYKKDGNETTHGFYRVSAKGPNLNKSTIWAPSATTNKGSIMTCREVKFTMPAKGTYTITVEPLSNNAAAKYWKVDWIRYWIQNASWMLTITSRCNAKW